MERKVYSGTLDITCSASNNPPVKSYIYDFVFLFTVSLSSLCISSVSLSCV